MRILKINTPISKTLLAILAAILLTVPIKTQVPITNTNGLVNIEIGEGVVVHGSFPSWYKSNGIKITKSQVTDLQNYLTCITGQPIGDLADEDYATDVYIDNIKKTYSIGDFAHGGIVFWVDESGQRGLVCAKEDQSEGVRWYAGYYEYTCNNGDIPLSGKINTTIIIASHKAIGDDGSTFAARICNELEITENGITYGDWHLPSKEELNLMYLNKATIDDTATSSDVGGSAFASGCYWSSSQYDNHRAWFHYFFDGSQDYGYMDVPNRVRAVRCFR